MTATMPWVQPLQGLLTFVAYEDYFAFVSNYLADEICEALIKKVIKYSPVAMKEPENYVARVQIMWASSLRDNGITALGNRAPAYSCHAIEHEVSAYYDITHGVELAIMPLLKRRLTAMTSCMLRQPFGWYLKWLVRFKMRIRKHGLRFMRNGSRHQYMN